MVNDTLPGFVPASSGLPSTGITVSAPAGWTCPVTGASIVCRSGAAALNPGASADIVITVGRPLFDSIGQSPGSCGAGAPATGAFCNTAGVAVDPAVPDSVGEINGANNQASDWVRIEREANVRTTAKNIVTGNVGRAGVDSQYVMSYLNEGTATVPGVVHTDLHAHRAAAHTELFAQLKFIGQLGSRLQRGIQNIVVNFVLHLFGKEFVFQMGKFAHGCSLPCFFNLL